MKAVGETVTFVAEDAMRYSGAEVTTVHTPETENSLIDLSYKDEGGNTISKTNVPHRDAHPKPNTNYWY